MDANKEKRYYVLFNYDIDRILEYLREKLEEASLPNIRKLLMEDIEHFEAIKSKKLKEGSVIPEGYRPKGIKAYLDKYVIGQDKAKKVLAIAAYKHLLRMLAAKADDGRLAPAKNNVILIGGTGTGKTYMCKLLAEYLNVPFGVSDLAQITQSGYQGKDIASITGNIYIPKNASSELHRKFSIILLDEIDKLATEKAQNNASVGTTNVQYELLKLIEGVDAPLVGTTDNVLFIGAGAFGGQLDENKTETSITKSIGFGGETKEDVKKIPLNEQLVDYGIIPELVGRFQNGAMLNNLTKKDLISIMKNSKESILNNFIKLFESEGKHLHFTEGALEEIAEVSIKKGTGARSLNSSLELLLQDLQFEHLGSDSAASIKITKDFVRKTLNA